MTTGVEGNTVNAAVYGCGLSASGALAIPRLVVNDKIVTAKEAHKPLRISHFNLKGIRHVAAGFGFSLFASRDRLYGSGLNNRQDYAYVFLCYPAF
ncbi:unnamed protein product [Cylicostephanus goldi]|uniref:Uncharacterized protein n=1 Tax=Cylicostephanus goldi TaxID=71465 RepID=A0A3P7MQ81_CYLGO|nr:unnamed protein product [Cylicostephanus goldi]